MIKSIGTFHHLPTEQTLNSVLWRDTVEPQIKKLDILEAHLKYIGKDILILLAACILESCIKIKIT